MTVIQSGQWRRLAAVSITSAALLAGCGSGDGDNASTPPPVATPAPAPAPVPPSSRLKAAADVGQPLSTVELDAVVAATTAAGFAGAARCDVQMVDITYTTVAPDGATPVDASGVVMLPTGAACPGPFPLVSYSRGTDLDKARTLAEPGDEEAQLVAAMVAAQGFVVAATDYLGYGRSTWPEHPYLHADSQASASIDAMRAARGLAAQRGVALDGKVFVTGYSQGGHAAMATQKAIETSLADEFALVGAAHMSGPYDLVGTVQDALAKLPLGDLGSTYYLPFAVTSLQKVYKNIYKTPSQFFKSPYDATIATLFPGPSDVSLQDLIAQDKMPILLSSLVTDDFIKAAVDSASPLHRALSLNSPTGFAPKARTLLCGGSRDPVVTFSNAEQALAAFQRAGSTAVTLYDVEDEPAYAPLLRDDLVPVDIHAGYHASQVPPLCLLQVRNLFLTL
jgi:pimeloyl-ACP methyl ester carboxylesterase